MRKENTPELPAHPSDPSRLTGIDAEEADLASEACQVSADQLAAYTDAVLAGAQPEAGPQTEPQAQDDIPPALARAVGALAAQAREAGVDPALAPARRQRMKVEIMAAWDSAHTPWHARMRASVKTHLRAAGRAFGRQPAWGAAAALLLLAFGMLLLVPLGAAPVAGTAVAPLGAGAWAGLGLVVAAAAVVIWLRGRRK